MLEEIEREKWKKDKKFFKNLTAEEGETERAQEG